MAAPHFADAVAKYDAARIALFGVPYDHTCSFRGGSRFAPRAIREASYNFETYMMDHQRDLLDVPVADLGDTPAYGPTVDMVAGVTRMAADVVGAGKIPIVIGGEHSLAPAVVRGFAKDIGVLGIDAHLDFRDSYLNDSWSHACSARRIADHVGVEHVVYLGVRSYSREEREDLERLGLTYVSVYDIHDRGMTAGAERALKAVSRDKIYLTIDMDGVDPAYAPAVGNPEPFGHSPFKVKELIGTLGPHLIGMDLNEVSPAWDLGQTALLGARLIREAIMAIGEARALGVRRTTGVPPGGDPFTFSGKRERRAQVARKAAAYTIPPPRHGFLGPRIPAAHAHPKAAREQRFRSSSQPVADDDMADHIVCDCLPKAARTFMCTLSFVPPPGANGRRLERSLGKGGPLSIPDPADLQT